MRSPTDITNCGCSRFTRATACEKILSRWPPVRSETTAKVNWSASLLSLSEVQGFLSPLWILSSLESAAALASSADSERESATTPHNAAAVARPRKNCFMAAIREWGSDGRQEY